MLKGAIVGFGEVARNGHWPAYGARAGAEIVAVVDRSAERRALAQSLDPKLATFSSLRDLAGHLAIDFVDVCTPPVLHAEPILEAIDHGWHVLCEKPFVLDAAVLPSIRQSADARGVAVVPVHNWKYAPILRAATAALQSGAIGALVRVEIETLRMQAAVTADGGDYNWRQDPRVSGGGILMDHGWHAIYLVLHWFGASAAEIRSARLTWPADGGVEREAAVDLDVAKGTASIFLTWSGAARRNTVRLRGSHGEIAVEDDKLIVHGRESSLETFPALSAGSHHADWFQAMLPDVVTCFQHRERSRPLFEEAVECLSLITRAYDADRTRVLQTR